MARIFDIAGKSGETYRYTLQDKQPIWPGGGNILYVKMLKGGPRVLFAAETDALLRGYDARWEEARDEYGATDILLRLNTSGEVRRAERDDIAARHRPVMNRAPDEDDGPDHPSHSEEQGNGATA